MWVFKALKASNYSPNVCSLSVPHISSNYIDESLKGGPSYDPSYEFCYVLALFINLLAHDITPWTSFMYFCRIFSPLRSL
jgi:hypothetical protein